MQNIVPDRKFVKARHKVAANFALGKVFDRIGQYAKRQHIGEHKAEDRCNDHKNTAKRAADWPSVKNINIHTPKKRLVLNLSG